MEFNEMVFTYRNLSNKGPSILKSVAPVHPYRDGQRVLTEVIGRDVTVVFPANGYTTHTIRVADPVDVLTPLLAKATADNPVYVAFDGFKLESRKRKINGAWVDRPVATADSVRVVQMVEFDDVDVEVD